MVQSIVGGATSYNGQSLLDILEDIRKWMDYTHEVKQLVLEHKELMHKSKFWLKVPFDFQNTIQTSLLYLDTILFDLAIVKTAIEKNCVTQKEVGLLGNIGNQSVRFNEEFGRTYRENEIYWHDYGNPDFEVAEDTYAKGRDYFVMMQDAGNAAVRLQDYVVKGNSVNILNVAGNISESQVQQGTVGSAQVMAFNYEEVLKSLKAMQRVLNEDSFAEDFGDEAEKVRSNIGKTIEMVENNESPLKIIQALTDLKSLAIGVSSGLIANGICALITKLPVWS